jgi:hypothetical protein
MIEKLTKCDKKASDFVYIESDEGYNHLPKPWREVEWGEWLYRISIWCTEFIETRQVGDFGDGQPFSIHKTTIFYQADSAYAIVHDKPQWEYKDGPTRFIHPPRFIIIGCKHENDEVRLSMHERKYTCRKCGFSRVIDSSG